MSTAVKLIVCGNLCCALVYLVMGSYAEATFHVSVAILGKQVLLEC